MSFWFRSPCLIVCIVLSWKTKQKLIPGGASGQHSRLQQHPSPAVEVAPVGGVWAVLERPRVCAGAGRLHRHPAESIPGSFEIFTHILFTFREEFAKCASNEVPLWLISLKFLKHRFFRGKGKFCSKYVFVKPKCSWEFDVTGIC